jgi:hypothetical protein
MKKRIKNLLEFKIEKSVEISKMLEKARKDRRKVRDLEKNEIENTAQIQLLRHILSDKEEKAMEWWYDNISDIRTEELITEYDLRKPIKKSDILKVWKKEKNK